VPVVIDRMDSVVETEPGSPAAAPAAPAADPADIDEEDFRHRYGSLLRTMIREEIERYLRSAD